MIQILSFRNDLINTIKPFFEQLTNNNNNEKYHLNEVKHIPFLKSFEKFQLDTLFQYQIINKEKYDNVVPKHKSSNQSEIIQEIIKGDEIEKLPKIIEERGSYAHNFLSKKFNGVQMLIPLMIECIIQKATKCFKYLLINNIEEPTSMMRHIFSEYYSKDLYNWDCMAVAIYYGEVEIIHILEERGIEKWSKPEHIEAALLSYRNSIVKELFKNLKKRGENEDENENHNIPFKSYPKGLLASVQNNNINGVELLINNGAYIQSQNSIIIKINKNN